MNRMHVWNFWECNGHMVKYDINEKKTKLVTHFLVFIAQSTTSQFKIYNAMAEEQLFLYDSFYVSKLLASSNNPT